MEGSVAPRVKPGDRTICTANARSIPASGTNPRRAALKSMMVWMEEMRKKQATLPRLAPDRYLGGNEDSA